MFSPYLRSVIFFCNQIRFVGCGDEEGVKVTKAPFGLRICDVKKSILLDFKSDVYFFIPHYTQYWQYLKHTPYCSTHQNFPTQLKKKKKTDLKKNKLQTKILVKNFYVNVNCYVN
jgi:hypothetical protein